MGQSRIRRGREVKEQRREDALERQAARDTRTDEEQLALLDKMGWRAGKERVRLSQRIQEREEEARRSKKKKDSR